MMMLENIGMRIKDFFSGKFSKDTLMRKISPIIVLSLVGSLAISWMLYPNYDWTSMDISQLGHPTNNPNGWIIWEIGIAITGVIYIPITSFVRKKLLAMNGIILNIGSFLFYFAAIGMIGLGVIPNFDDGLFLAIHRFNAALAFGGMFLGLFFAEIPLLKDQKWRWKILPTGILTWGVIVGFGMTGIIRLSAPHLDLPWYFNFSFWEWFFLIALFMRYLIFVLLITSIEE
jgi:hypothetical membrane protein